MIRTRRQRRLFGWDEKVLSRGKDRRRSKQGAQGYKREQVGMVGEEEERKMVSRWWQEGGRGAGEGLKSDASRQAEARPTLGKTTRISQAKRWAGEGGLKITSLQVVCVLSIRSPGPAAGGQGFSRLSLSRC